MNEDQKTSLGTPQGVSGETSTPEKKPVVLPHPDVDKKYSRMAFIERNVVWVRRVLYVVAGLLFFLFAFWVGSYLIRTFLPKPQVVTPVDPSTIPPSDFRDITFASPVLVPNGERTYDVVVRITDANKQWGVKDLQYRVNLLNASGTLLKSQMGQRYVLPGSTEVLVVPSVTTSEAAASATVELLSGTFVEPVTKETLSLEVRQRHFSPNTTDGIARFTGTLRNGSNYDLKEVDVVMLVKNASGTVVSTNFTQANTLKSNEDRSIILNFDRSFDDTATYDIFISTNPLDRSTFLLKQGQAVEF